MRRKPTLAEATGAEFDQLARLVRNLLVDNKNFESGYYYREYPSSRDFVRRVLREHAQHIIERIETLKEDVVANLRHEVDDSETDRR